MIFQFGIASYFECKCFIGVVTLTFDLTGVSQQILLSNLNYVGVKSRHGTESLYNLFCYLGTCRVSVA